MATEPEVQPLVVRDGLDGLMGDPRAAAALREALPDYLPRRRWFATKNERVAAARLAYAAPLPAARGVLIAEVEVETGGRADRYLLPLGLAWEEPAMPPLARSLALAPVRDGDGRSGILTDGFATEALPRAVLHGLRDGARVQTPDGEIRFDGTARAAALEGIDAAPIRWLTAEQSNSSLLVGDLAMVKLIRRVGPGVHPEAEMTRHLTALGYANTAPLVGEVVRVAGDGTPHTLAIAQGVIPNEGDAWTWVLDALGGVVRAAERTEGASPGFEPLNAFAGTVGRRLGELHRALATPTADADFRPVEADAAAVEGWAEGARAQIVGALDALDARRDALDPESRAVAEAVTARRAAVLDALGGLAEAGRGTLMTRVHGDFHLGQVLVSRGDAFLIDFEGEPARSLDQRRAKGSPLRDVAGLIRSIDYAAASAGMAEGDAGPRTARDRRPALLDAFRRQATAAFLEHYWAASGGGSEGGAACAAVLDLMTLEKAAYEISYEVANRPTWIPIPLRGFGVLVDRLTSKESRA